MQTKKKTLPELEAELQQHERNIIEYEKKKSQYENQIKTILHRANNEKRKIRTHRLIERGAIAESLIPNVETLNNEQVKGLLYCLRSAVWLVMFSRDFIHYHQNNVKMKK